MKCQFDVLCNCISDKKIKQCLESLPRGLDNTYIRIFEQTRRLHPDDLELIKKLFSWLVHSVRPLKLSELAEAVTFDPDERTLDFSAIPTEPNNLLGLTGGLLVLTGDEDVVGLSHYSVKEFLLSDRIKDSSVGEFFEGDDLAHLDLVVTSMKYLMLDDFSDGPCRSVKRLRSRKTKYHFVQYAANNWMNHYKALPARAGLSLNSELITMFSEQDNTKKFQSMEQIEQFNEALTYSYHMEEAFVSVFQDLCIASDPFYYGALYGLDGLLLWLLEMGYNINAKGGYYEYPLLAAAFGEHASWTTVQKLLDMGADIHVSSSMGNAANAIAIRGTPQDWTLLKKLAQCELDLQRISSYHCSRHRTVLQAIASHPSDDSTMIEYLLEHGVDIDDKQMFPDGDGGTEEDKSGPALQHACSQGNLEVVRLLLARGSRKDFGKCELGTPLTAAVLAQHHHIVGQPITSSRREGRSRNGRLPFGQRSSGQYWQ